MARKHPNAKPDAHIRGHPVTYRSSLCTPTSPKGSEFAVKIWEPPWGAEDQPGLERKPQIAGARRYLGSSEAEGVSQVPSRQAGNAHLGNRAVGISLNRNEFLLGENIVHIELNRPFDPVT